MLAAQRRWIARVALLVLLGTFSSPLLAVMHLALADDPACDPAGLGPRHAASQFETTQPPAPGGHCEVCHWIRVVTHRAPARLAAVDVVLLAEPFVTTAGQAGATHPVFTPLAPRAPPALAL